MPDLLLELFSEEIPARMQEGALRQLQERVGRSLEEEGIAPESLRGFVTPRRLALLATGLPDAQADATVEKKGPKTGAPEAAIDGFVRSSGVAREKLEKRMVGKDEIYFAVIHKKGGSTAIVLKPLIEKILAEFSWPKSMRWGTGETAWVRPLHSILCLFDGKVVPVEFAGVKAGDFTYGHRFLAPEKMAVRRAGDYEKSLKTASVVADADMRRQIILEQARALAAKHGLALKEDKGLLDEVTGLVEWPVVLMGGIDPGFMDLPPEVLTSEMRAHQKYFALLDGDGTLAPHFLMVSNMETADGGKAVTAGNERVLRARLADGRFFYDQDRKRRLEDWAQGLKDITFHAKVGSVAQKVQRIGALAERLAPYVASSLRGAMATKQSSPERQAASAARGDELKEKVLRAAFLCKADLTTGMVGEFPDLQGVMGRYYALHQKEEAAVADAIRDHYLPLGPDSPVPTAPVSVSIALADKLDTLISLFAAGEKPTGSKDPFALRRAALGVIRILLENKIRLPLKNFLNDELLVFFRDRLKVMLRDEGIRHDALDAVMADGDDDFLRVTVRARTLQEFLAGETGEHLLTAYARAANILAIEEKKDKTTYRDLPKEARLSEKAESALLKALAASRERMETLRQREDHWGALAQLAELRAPLDQFFLEILVNSPDKEVRANRLRLLSLIRDTMDEVADFSRIEGRSAEQKAA